MYQRVDPGADIKGNERKWRMFVWDAENTFGGGGNCKGLPSPRPPPPRSSRLRPVRPDLGPIIEGSGGLRKVRWARPGRGKRSGVRVIYYWAVNQNRLLMLLIYAKSERDDLSHEQLQILRKVVEAEYK